jgi:hypothetical protein
VLAFSSFLNATLWDFSNFGIDDTSGIFVIAMFANLQYESSLILGKMGR